MRVPTGVWPALKEAVVLYKGNTGPVGPVQKYFKKVI